MTPILMKYLAGSFVPIDFVSMMISIVKIVILPIVIGLVFNHFFHGKAKWLDQTMPIISMAGITLIIMIITAAGRDDLLTIGMLLIIAAIIHNLMGYLLGYWGCRLLKMKEQDCRTIALEVGMQNGGLASGIALEMGKNINCWACSSDIWSLDEYFRFIACYMVERTKIQKKLINKLSK